MAQQPKRNDRPAKAATGAKPRSVSQERHAERVAEIAGKQARLKREAQERRERRAKTSTRKK